jgi:hypothetical protein
VDGGALGAVGHLIEATRRVLGCASCSVIAVGGDAAFFASHLSGVTQGQPDFTLRGLAAVASASPELFSGEQ